jgi:hypothetical protein
VLVHRCPNGRWEEPWSELFGLLERHGEDALRAAFVRCVEAKTFQVDAVRAALAEVAA